MLQNRATRDSLPRAGFVVAPVGAMPSWFAPVVAMCHLTLDVAHAKMWYNSRMTITYQVKEAVYVNLTNRCPCACTFCLRNNADGVYGSDSLWLEREPTLDEVVADLAKWNYSRFREVVFCGYGEPTERLDVLLAAAAHLKSLPNAPRVRVNTNGLSDLINGKPTAALFTGKVDCISISLNTDDPAEYLATCRPKFGDAAYPALLEFAHEAVAAVPEVVMTVVGEPVTSLDKQERCRAIAESLGARLRVRPYEG